MLIFVTQPQSVDNITPPIASCLGDLLTLCIIGLVSSVLVRTIDSATPFILMVLLTLGLVLSIITTMRNQLVRHLIFMGWTPLLGAMVISSGTGMVLDRFVDRYEGYGLLSIVLGGEFFSI
jgi:solute carrier family 41